MSKEKVKIFDLIATLELNAFFRLLGSLFLNHFSLGEEISVLPLRRCIGLGGRVDWICPDVIRPAGRVTGLSVSTSD